jgi:hypothetical protein
MSREDELFMQLFGAPLFRNSYRDTPAESASACNGKRQSKFVLQNLREKVAVL